jgi:hypothetical protein
VISYKAYRDMSETVRTAHIARLQNWRRLFSRASVLLLVSLSYRWSIPDLGLLYGFFLVVPKELIKENKENERKKSREKEDKVSASQNYEPHISRSA